MANDEIEALTEAINKAPNGLMKAKLYLERGGIHKAKGESDMAEFDLAFADYNEARMLGQNNEEIINSVARARSPAIVTSGTLNAVSALKVAYFPVGLPTGTRGKIIGATSPPPRL
jgi:hypothetical protein